MPFGINVTKIAILNPYLLGGHFETAEIESARRFAIAAQQFNIDVKVLANSWEIEDFNPDFVITITYQIPKLTPYPTYGLLTMPPSWVKNEPRFVRNILSYDGFLTTSQSTIIWLKMLCEKYNKQMHYAHAAFSIKKIEYSKTEFTKAKAVYIGTNWDKNRHHNLFSYLDNGAFVKCFGPVKSWQNYSPSLYGGEIPFDGISTINTYHSHGIGLCINHPDFDREGIPSSRTFEIPAASAISICTLNDYTESIFNDTVLYVDQNTSIELYAEQIIEAVKWIRSHPKEASEMAYAANEIFNNQISLEVFIPNILILHQQVLDFNGTKNISFNNQQTQAQDKVIYFVTIHNNDYAMEKTIQSLFTQSYSNMEICLICNEMQIDSLPNMNNITISYINLLDSDLNELVHQKINTSGAKWIGFVECDDILFGNHVELLLTQYHNLAPEIQRPIQIIAGGSVSLSEKPILFDDIQDEKMIPFDNKMKITYLPFDHGPTYHSAPIRACLFKASSVHDILLNKFEAIIPKKMDIPLKEHKLKWLDVAHITSSNTI